MKSVDKYVADIAERLKEFIGKPNTEETWTAIKSKLEVYASKLKHEATYKIVRNTNNKDEEI